VLAGVEVLNFFDIKVSDKELGVSEMDSINTFAQRIEIERGNRDPRQSI